VSCLCSLQLALHRTQRLPRREDLVLLSLVQTTRQLAHIFSDIRLLSVVLTSCLKSMESWEVRVAVSDLSGDVGDGDKEVGRPTYFIHGLQTSSDFYTSHQADYQGLMNKLSKEGRSIK